MGPSRKEKGRTFSSTSKVIFCKGIYIASFPGGYVRLRLREQNNHMFHCLVRESIQYCSAHNPASDCAFFVGVWNAFVSQSLVTPASKQHFCASDIKPSAPAQLSLQTPLRCVSEALGTESINYQKINIMIMGTADRVDIFYLLHEY